MRVIKPPHALGFLDRDLPKFSEYPSQTAPEAKREAVPEGEEVSAV